MHTLCKSRSNDSSDLIWIDYVVTSITNHSLEQKKIIQDILQSTDLVTGKFARCTERFMNTTFHFANHPQGDHWYVLSHKWLEKWKDYVKYEDADDDYPPAGAAPDAPGLL